MATINAIHSIRVLDADGEKASLPVYMHFADTVTLTALFAFMSGTLATLDPILDGQIVGQSIQLLPPLPGGLKSAPVAGAEIEVTGLLNYLLDSIAFRSFGQDLPAFARAKFAGNKIILTDTDVLAWTDRSSATGGTAQLTNQDWSSELAGVQTGAKTFRKHRRQTKRT